MNPGAIDGGRRRRCRRAAVRSVASVAAIVVVGVGWAVPAGAHPDVDGHGTISLSDTGDLGSPPSVSGTLTGASALGLGIETIDTIALTATPTGPTGGSQVSADGCAMATSGQCDTSKVSFQWQLPGLAYNGPYEVNATATHCLLGCGPVTVTPRRFRLAADPAAPGDVKAEPGGDRNVVLSWQRNAEPDILYYRVSRKDGSGSFTHLGDVRHPASGRPGFTDTTTSRTPGGEFAYRVVAVRKGASGDDTTTLTSRASDERSVTVAPPPTTVPPGAPGSEIKPAGTDTNIGGYLAGQPGALPSPKPMFLDLPDTGFEGSLPFGQLPGEDMSEPGEEDAVPATLETRRLQEFNRGRPLIPIAAGAILLLLAAHLRLFNKRLKPEGVRRQSSAAEFIATLDASKHAKLHLDVEAAVANGGHHRATSGAALTDLPEWGQFRGVTLLPATPDTVEAADDEAGEEVWAEDDAERALESADAEAEEAELDGWAVANGGQRPQTDLVIDGEQDEDDFVVELEPWDDEVVAELEGQAEDDEEAWDEAAERAAWGDDAVAELEPVEDAEFEQDEEVELLTDLESDEEYDEAELLSELEPDEEDEIVELLSELEPDQEADLESDEEAEIVVLLAEEEAELLAEPEADEEDEIVAELESDDEAELLAEVEPDEEAQLLAELEADEEADLLAEVEPHDEGEDEDEIVAELVRGSGPVVIPEVDEPEEVVAVLVPGPAPVVVPQTAQVTDPEPEPEVDLADAEAPAAAAATTNGNGSHPVSDFDDFEWSEEAQYAEPEVEVFVSPTPGRRKRLARR